MPNNHGTEYKTFLDLVKSNVWAEIQRELLRPNGYTIMFTHEVADDGKPVYENTLGWTIGRIDGLTAMGIPKTPEELQQLEDDFIKAIRKNKQELKELIEGYENVIDGEFN